MSSEKVDETDQSRQAILQLLPQGSPLHRYVQWACGAHGSPPIYHLGCALALQLYELSWRGFRLSKVVDVGEYPLTAQFLMLGQSSTGKTSAFNSMQDFANAVWTQTATRPESDPWVELEGSIEGITSAIQDRYQEDTDSTPVILFDPEISKIFARREPLTELLCKLADARSIQTNYRGKQRKKKKDPNQDQIVNPRVNAIFCSTEAQLAPHFKESHRMGGMFPRMIWLRPDFQKTDIWLAQDHVGARPLAQQRKDAVTRYAGWIVELQMAAHEQGYSFQFSSEAHATLHNELFNPILEQFDPLHDDNMHAVRVRLLEKARVFAALHAALHLRMVVVPDDVYFAARLVRIFLGMLTPDSPVRSLGTADDLRHAKRLETLILQAGDEGCLRREIYTKMRTNKVQLDDAIELLVDREVIFADHSNFARAGRYVHFSTPLGQKIQQTRAAHIAEEQEMRATIGSNGGAAWRARRGQS